MQIDEFDYLLPNAQIAQRPCEPREAARLLILHRQTGSVKHLRIADLPDSLSAGDLLVFNDTRVIRARLLGRRPTGGHWEGIFVRIRDDGWEFMTRCGGKPKPGEAILLDRGQSLRLIRKTCEGTWIALPTDGPTSLDWLELAGHVPIPGYIRQGVADAQDDVAYQTIFAREPGAIAAPTAGLHFTPGLLDRLEQRGVERAFVTLHVGPGTFQPVRVQTVADHEMHAEWCAVSTETADHIRAARARGSRVIAVGTTSVRTLESRWSDGQVLPGAGETRLFITPGYTFHAVDGMLTNFHLPRSTLLMLVAAFAGLESTLAAYREAIDCGYRFYSYGDAMLIL